jgi:hypothetical protein
LYSFTPKAKNTNENGSGYIILRVVEPGPGIFAGELSVSDGNKVLEYEDLNHSYKLEEIRSNNQTIAKKINELKSKGYELISSNSSSNEKSNVMQTNYIFIKK